MISISQALQKSVETLRDISETPNLDAEVLLSTILGKSRAWIISHPETLLTIDQNSGWRSDLNSLQAGVSLPYVIGHWEFYGLKFLVTPDTLIPRPETELIVDLALDWLKNQKGQQTVTDIGTGTGCIAIALAKNFPGISVIATDTSHPALKVAYQNIIQHGVEHQVHPLHCDLLPPSPVKFDIICTNLPYIPTKKLEKLPIFGKEPTYALDGGTDGLDLITRLLERAPGKVNQGGLLLLEIDSSKGSKAQSIARRYFPSAEITVCPDLAGHDRVLEILVQ